MVAENDRIVAEKEIEKALREFVNNRAYDAIHVFEPAGSTRVDFVESEWGNIHAVVGSVAFEGMSMGVRQDEVWKFLRERVPIQYLTHLVAVHTWDPIEYEKYFVAPERN